MTNIIPLTPPPKPQLKCSFCDKPSTAVTSLISNQREGRELRAICNECLDRATQRLMEVK